MSIRLKAAGIDTVAIMGINQIGYDGGNPVAIRDPVDPFDSTLDLDNDGDPDIDEDAINAACSVDQECKRVREIPWVQDVDTVSTDSSVVSAWSSWQINYRDVLVVAPDGAPVHVRNMSNVGLQDPDNFCDLLAIIDYVRLNPNVLPDELDAFALNNNGECPPGIPPLPTD